MKMRKMTTYALLGGMGVVTLSAIMVASAGASSQERAGVSDRSDDRPLLKRASHMKGSPLLELFDLNRAEYIDLLKEDVSLREYAETENINLEEIQSEAESRMVDRLDDALEAGKITGDEYDEKLNAFRENFEVRLDAEDLEDLPEFEKRVERREDRRGRRMESNQS